MLGMLIPEKLKVSGISIHRALIPIANWFQMRTVVLVIFSVILLATFNGIAYSPYIESIIA